MIDFLEAIIPYISGLYTLPWILVGFLVTYLVSLKVERKKIDRVMKKIGLILLYFFVPVLVFRIFLNTQMGAEEIMLIGLIVFVLIITYGTAVIYALLSKPNDKQYLKTVLANQGRSTAFIGGALLGISHWALPTAIFIAFSGISIFAIIPFILTTINDENISEKEKHQAVFPLILRIYPWYFITLGAIIPISIQKAIGGVPDLGNFGTLLHFYTALTIPAALFYVGAGISPSDLKIDELKKIMCTNENKAEEHWVWVQKMLLLLVIVTPLLNGLIFGLLLLFNIITKAWFSVIIINALLPVTSTNMFLLPYGLNKKATAHVITWSTLICVPIVIVLITILSGWSG